MRRYLNQVLRYPWLVILATLGVTVMLALQARDLEVIIDTNQMLPQHHPYVETTNLVEKVFGSKYVVVIGVTATEGDVFQPKVLQRVQQITAALLRTPEVVKGNLLSVSARRAKDIEGTDGGMRATPLLPLTPATEADAERLRKALARNPIYQRLLISDDGRTTAIVAEFKHGAGGFRAIMQKVDPIVAQARDDSVDIRVGGNPVFLAQTEKYSQRIVPLFLLAILVVGLIHFEAFRTWQGLVLPLVTALLAVAWGLGMMGMFGVPMDVFNVTTPILILAIAAGHAVQILKRYYEEYARLSAAPGADARQASREAIVEALCRIGPVTIAAGIVASLGFLSLIVFDIGTIRTFGIFTGLGILSAIVLELTFIPALRSKLRPPTRREGSLAGGGKFWMRLSRVVSGWALPPLRGRLFAAAIALTVLSVALGQRVVVDSAIKGFFSPALPFKQDDVVLNRQLGGTNTLYVVVRGDKEGTVKDPAVLGVIREAQRYLKDKPHVGKTVSIVDLIERMNQSMTGDEQAGLPTSADLISQYLLLYSMTGDPGDFDPYVDYGYQSANLTVFLKSDSTHYVEELIAGLKAHLTPLLPPGVTLSFGGNVPQSAALNEVMVRSKLLNIVQISVVVYVISCIIFRSFVAGLLVMLPLLLAVVVNFGVMGLTGMRMNIPNALTSAMAVGIGADYAIYMLYRLREEVGRHTSEREMVQFVMATAGQAIMFVSTAIAAGYAVLLFSIGYYIHTWMAILIATAMLVSASSAILLTTALVVKFKPRFVYQSGGRPVAVRGAALLGVLLVAVLAAAPPSAHADDDEAHRLMQKSYAASRVPGSSSDAVFVLTNSAGQERTRKMWSFTKLQPNGQDNRRVTRFVEPADVRGTATLMVEHAGAEDDIWIYLPALKKVRRLVSNNKRDAFVGTDFSYGDVIGHRVDDWRHRLLRKEPVDGVTTAVIESTPASDAVKESSGYARRLSWIRIDQPVVVRGELYDLSGQLLKKTAFAEIQNVDPAGGFWQPMRMESLNVQTGHKTVIKLTSFRLDKAIKEEVFTPRYLERD